MKKTLTLVALLALAWVGVAQNTFDNSRRTVVLGDVSGKNAAQVKYYMLDGLAGTARLNIFDSRMYNNIPQALRDNVKVDALFTAVVDSLPVRKVKRITTGEMVWEAHCYVTLTVRDPKSNAVRTTQHISGSGSDATDQDAATDAAMMTLCNDLNSFIDEYYVVRGNVVSLDEVKGNKAQRVTIDVGSASSIYSNMQFNVLNAAGEKIGTAQVKEITGSNTTTLKVNTGTEAVKTAIESGDAVTVVSRKLDLLNDLITFEKKGSSNISDPKPDCNKMHTVLYLGTTGNSTTNDAINEEIMRELTATKRMWFLTLDQYNSLDAAKRSAMSIDAVMMAFAGGHKNTSEARESYTSYTTKCKYFVLLSDIRTGEVLYTEDYNCVGTSTKSQAEAITRAAKNTFLTDNMIDRAYPIYTSVLTVEKANKKNTKAEAVSIGVGTNSACYEGMMLNVYTQSDEGVWTKIGEVKVKTMVDDGNSSCTVKKGGDAIMHAFQENIPTRVVTKPKEFLGGLLKF